MLTVASFSAKLCASSTNLSDKLWTQSYSSVPFSARILKKGKTRLISIVSKPIKVMVVVAIVVLLVVFVWKKLGPKNCWSKKNLGPKKSRPQNFGNKKISDSNNFWYKKMWPKKIYNKFLVKFFLSNKYLGQKGKYFGYKQLRYSWYGQILPGQMVP